MDRYAYLLRGCAEKAGLAPVKQIAAQPGVVAVYRATIHRTDWRASDVVVTVIRTEAVTREAIYVGRFENKPIRRAMDIEEYNAFVHLIDVKTFDKLRDQDDRPSPDLCMMERAAGTFVKSVIFSPQEPGDVYANLAEALRLYLPEALREIQ